MQTFAKGNMGQQQRRMTFRRCNPSLENDVVQLERIFRDVIAPTYGDQTRFIRKIVVGSDRQCEFLYFNDDLAGVIVYKTHLVDEFGCYGIEQAFELKTFLVLREDPKCAGLLFCLLMNQVAWCALSLGANCIVGTINHDLISIFKAYRKCGWLCKDKISEESRDGDNSDLVIYHENPMGLFNLTQERIKRWQDWLRTTISYDGVRFSPSDTKRVYGVC